MDRGAAPRLRHGRDDGRAGGRARRSCGIFDRPAGKGAARPAQRGDRARAGMPKPRRQRPDGADAGAGGRPRGAARARSRLARACWPIGELYEALLAGRNRAWAARLENLLSAAAQALRRGGRGAHGRSTDGLPALLEARGYQRAAGPVAPRPRRALRPCVFAPAGAIAPAGSGAMVIPGGVAVRTHIHNALRKARSHERRSDPAGRDARTGWQGSLPCTCVAMAVSPP